MKRHVVTWVLVLGGLFAIASSSYGGTGVLNDYNPWDVTIPDNGSHVYTDLDLSGAPVGAVITKVRVYYEIRHTYPGDLDVWLTAYYDGAWHDYYLYHRGDLGSSDDIVETRDNLHYWDGASPNQTWYLSVQDRVSGDVGYIDFFELWLSYSYNEDPSVPNNEDPYVGQSNVSVTTDLDWSCSDPDNDTLYYTVYFEKDNSSPDNIIKNDSTGSSANPGTLEYDSHYYWQVRADDHNGGVSWGPVWNFSTEPEPVISADIQVTSVTPDPAVAGSSITIYYTVTNTGNVAYSFGVGSEIWQAGSKKDDVSEHMTPTVSISSSYNGSFPYTIPPDWSERIYTARCAVWTGSPGLSTWLDSDDRNFAVQAQSPDSVLPAEIIVYPINCSRLRDELVTQELIKWCLDHGIPAISLLIKSDTTGRLYFPTSVPNRYPYDDCQASDLADFIRLAHEHSLRVYAWIPMFNDKVLYQHGTEDYSDPANYRMYVRKPDGTPEPVLDWVSPAVDAVKGNLRSVLEEALNEYDFDGVRIDHSRYEGIQEVASGDWADMSYSARSEFGASFIDPINLAGPGDPYWIDWIHWRADLISQFNISVRDLVISVRPSAHVGTYLLPTSAIEGGYESNSESGQRYEDYKTMGITPMPMVYWQDWTQENLENATDYINEKLFYAKQLSSPSEVIPVFSVTRTIRCCGPPYDLTESEIKQYMELCGQLSRINGIRRISYYTQNEWKSEYFERIRASYIGPVPAVTPGFLDFGDVPVGNSTAQAFTIHNVGSGTLEVSVSAPAPFNILGPQTDFTLSEDEAVTVSIGFTPIDYASYEGSLTFFGDDFSMTRNVKGCGVSCTYSIDPTSEHFGFSGGSGSVSVTALDGCDWTATSNDAWVHITSGSSGSGDGSVGYSVDANSSASLRTGTMTIAGEVFTVTQDGVSCIDDCSSGETRCNGDYKQTCGDYDADSCLEWPPSTGGPGNEYCPNGCSSGECQPAACTDADFDEYYAEAGCGTEVDCDDNDETVYPGATEVINDGIDQDCDGSDFRIDGDNGIIISADFVDPNDPEYTEDKPEDLIYGPIEIEIDITGSGNPAIFTVHLPEAAPPGYICYKHTDNDGWIDFSRDVISGSTGDGAEFNGAKTEATFYVTDNSQYDDNPALNIVGDPFGIAKAPVPPQPPDGGDGGCFIDTAASCLGW